MGRNQDHWQETIATRSAFVTAQLMVPSSKTENTNRRQTASIQAPVDDPVLCSRYHMNFLRNGILWRSASLCSSRRYLILLLPTWSSLWDSADVLGILCELARCRGLAWLLNDEDDCRTPEAMFFFLVGLPITEPFPPVEVPLLLNFPVLFERALVLWVLMSSLLGALSPSGTKACAVLFVASKSTEGFLKRSFESCSLTPSSGRCLPVLKQLVDSGLYALEGGADWKVRTAG